jgi:hypothetical protein
VQNIPKPRRASPLLKSLVAGVLSRRVLGSTVNSQSPMALCQRFGPREFYVRSLASPPVTELKRSLLQQSRMIIFRRAPVCRKASIRRIEWNHLGFKVAMVPENASRVPQGIAKLKDGLSNPVLGSRRIESRRDCGVMSVCLAAIRWLRLFGEPRPKTLKL